MYGATYPDGLVTKPSHAIERSWRNEGVFRLSVTRKVGGNLRPKHVDDRRERVA